MARAAGNNPNYTFVLHNDNTGRYIKDVTISLPSCSTIVKRTLAAPQLVGWAYRSTRDSISGLVSVLLDIEGLDLGDITDMLTDADWLEEYLKENGLRPDDIKDQAAERGTREHAALERLAKIGLEDPEHAVHEAYVLMDNAKTGWERAIGDWWTKSEPWPVESETVLPCPEYGYCGSVDLVDIENGAKIVIDLKTRKEGADAYESDMFQVEGYWTAYDLLHPSSPADKGRVLVAREDGTWVERDITVGRGAFLDLKRVHDRMYPRKEK